MCSTDSTRTLISALLVALLSAGCASLSPEERADEMAALDAMGEESLTKLIEQTPDLQAVFDEAPGYMVVDMKVTKVPIVGGGGGTGVVVDGRDGSRSYVKVKRADFGGGWGVRSYKLFVVFLDEQLFEKVESGGWKFEAGADAAAGSAALEGGTGDIDDDARYKSYTLAEGGAAATVTIRAIRMSPYLN